MKNLLTLLIVLATIVSCQEEKTSQTTEEYQEEVKAKITEFDRLYFEAWENEDLDLTMSFLDEGFINMFIFGLTQTKEECPDAWKDIFDTYSIEDVEYESIELIVDQNYAFETGILNQKWITENKQDTIIYEGRGMSVFKKQLDDSWKMYRLIGQQ